MVMHIPLNDIVSAYKILAEINYKKGNYLVAENALKKALEFLPKSAELWLYLGQVYEHAERADQARECKEKALEYQ
jgi:tetratricopeptide (TPR) repeat protein